MRYEGTIWRPPSEAYSLIVQVTVGCSHNKCIFCNMYKEKCFHVRSLQEIIEDFTVARRHYNRVEKIFLADGDALIARTDMLSIILDYIKRLFPECTNVTSYASPKSILIKSHEELKTLKTKGLKMVYLGLESGNDRVLKNVKKGADSKKIIEAGRRIKEAGIHLSVTVIAGLGGKEFWQEHAVETGRVLSEINPEYIGILTLQIYKGTAMESLVDKKEFFPLAPKEVISEIKLMIENTYCEGSILRSNHISNYINIGGTLNKDKEVILAQLNEAINLDRSYVK